MPHGVSVALTGPSVFRFTAPSSPERHRSAAEIFGAAATTDDGVDERRVSDEDVGKLLHDRIAAFLVELGMPRGLDGIGYKGGDIPELVKGTLPQRRVL